MNALLDRVKPLLDALEGLDVRLVGGAVRAWLRKDPLTSVEIDLAVAALPEDVEKALHAAGIVTTDEGKRWGTVTAHLNGVAYELTCLRTDKYLPGSRYPSVAFGVDWETDAARRDFSFNALYLGPDEVLYDPFGGAEDLKNGIVRFIGDPEKRLAEDPLRMYRFWRFCAYYGMGGVTPEVLECCRNALPGVVSASRSRRAEEWRKIMEAPQGPSVLAEMERQGLADGMRVE